MITAASTAWIAGAGFVAGVINAVAGGGTLISFPALLWTGLDPMVANATNAVALWPGSLASSVGLRRHLTLPRSRSLIGMLVLPLVLGALTGAGLLLRTPRLFASLVPFLILGASVLLAAQEFLVRRFPRVHDRPHTRAGWIGVGAFQFLIGLYGGYFGAGIGILLLAALALAGISDMHERTATKTLLATFVNGLAALVFVSAGVVPLLPALTLAVGAIVGGYTGARVCRGMSGNMLRWSAVLLGGLLSMRLLWRD